MTYSEFMKNKELQGAAAVYTEKLGGHFVCEEPGDALVYLDANGDAYGQIDDYYTAERLLSVLKKSVERTRPMNLIRTLWCKLDGAEPDPDMLY